MIENLEKVVEKYRQEMDTLDSGHLRTSTQKWRDDLPRKLKEKEYIHYQEAAEKYGLVAEDYGDGYIFLQKKGYRHDQIMLNENQKASADHIPGYVECSRIETILAKAEAYGRKA